MPCGDPAARNKSCPVARFDHFTRSPSSSGVACSTLRESSASSDPIFLPPVPRPVERNSLLHRPVAGRQPASAPALPRSIPIAAWPNIFPKNGNSGGYGKKFPSLRPTTILSKIALSRAADVSPERLLPSSGLGRDRTADQLGHTIWSP